MFFDIPCLSLFVFQLLVYLVLCIPVRVPVVVVVHLDALHVVLEFASGDEIEIRALPVVGSLDSFFDYLLADAHFVRTSVFEGQFRGDDSGFRKPLPEIEGATLGSPFTQRSNMMYRWFAMISTCSLSCLSTSSIFENHSLSALLRRPYVIQRSMPKNSSKKRNGFFIQFWIWDTFTSFTAGGSSLWCPVTFEISRLKKKSKNAHATSTSSISA